MNCLLIQEVRSSPALFARARGQSTAMVDDPLDPMRGVLIGTLMSVLGFWLPLALVLAG